MAKIQIYPFYVVRQNLHVKKVFFQPNIHIKVDPPSPTTISGRHGGKQRGKRKPFETDNAVLSMIEEEEASIGRNR